MPNSGVDPHVCEKEPVSLRGIAPRGFPQGGRRAGPRPADGIVTSHGKASVLQLIVIGHRSLPISFWYYPLTVNYGPARIRQWLCEILSTPSAANSYKYFARCLRFRSICLRFPETGFLPHRKNSLEKCAPAPPPPHQPPFSRSKFNFHPKLPRCQNGLLTIHCRCTLTIPD